MFNKKNPTEMEIVRILAHGEGLIAKEDFIAISNKTLFSRYKTKGYLAPAKNGEKGTFRVTERFKREYRRQIDPVHRFSGSGSPTHNRGLNRVLYLLPKGADLTTGQQLKEDFDSYRKTKAYHRALFQIQQRNLRELQEKEAQAATDTTRDYTYELNTLRGRYEISCDSRRACSAPDLAATMTREELEDFRGALGNWYLNVDMNQRKLYLIHQAISKIQELERTASGSVTVHIEIVTGSYGPVEIEQKENYEETTGSFLILLPA